MENNVKIEDLNMVIKMAKELRDTLKIWDYKDEEMYKIPGMFLNTFKFVTQSYIDVMKEIIDENIERLEAEKELEEDEDEEYEILLPCGIITTKGNLIIFDNKRNEVRFKLHYDKDYVVLCDLDDVYEVRSYKSDGTIAVDVHNSDNGIDTFYFNSFGIEC